MLWKCRMFKKLVVLGAFAVVMIYGILVIFCDKESSVWIKHLPIKDNLKMDNTHMELNNLLTLSVSHPVRENIIPGSCPKGLTKANNNNDVSITRLKTNISYPKILILTPVKSAKDTLKGYFQLLCSLDYPRHLISVAVGEDSSSDNTQQMAQMFINSLQGYFNRVEFYKLDLEFHLPARVVRHNFKWQLPRRRHLAKARNQLLQKALQDEDWVLWLDSDLIFYKPDLIQRLLEADKDIVAASCMTRDSSGKYTIYDRNSWRETEASRNFVDGKNPGYLMLEGYYEPTMRIYLPKLGYEGDVVKIDGVGGCALLVRANCHRNGLIFPPFIYKHHIETEGLAKMAEEFKCGVYGMPNYFVIHKS